MGAQALPPFGLLQVVTRWQFAPVVTGFVMVAAALYLWGVLRVRRRHPARPWPLWRTALFLGGLAVVVIATQSGIGRYDDVLFWDHMILHLLLIMVAPPLLVVGQPITLALHASRNPLHTWVKKAVRSRVVSALTFPPFGAVLYLATIVGTHLTSFENVVLTDPAVRNAELALYLIAGYLYFLPLIGQEPVRWRVHARSTTKPSASPKPSPWPITAITKWTRALFASSTPMARACSSMTAVSFPTL